jgi:membrane associated rhomboid family serine protease
MIPLKDLNPRRSFPYMTLLLIAVNIAVFAHQLTLSPVAGEAFVKTYGLVPSRVELALDGHRYSLFQALWPFFTSMFLHGGFLHIIGNMWFLWIFGDNVEDQFGHFGYLLFYLVCGIGSGVTQTMFSWGSHIPAIGASGAISGVLGAYLLYFPRARILTLIPLFIIFFTARIPAMVFIGLWFVLQFLSGLGSLGGASTGGIAVWAHVGGFLLGLLLAGVVKLSGSSAT